MRGMVRSVRGNACARKRRLRSEPRAGAVQAEINHSYEPRRRIELVGTRAARINGRSPQYGPMPNWSGYDSAEVRAIAESIQAKPYAQGQSTPVHALSFLLRIKLMPRIRN